MSNFHLEWSRNASSIIKLLCVSNENFKEIGAEALQILLTEQLFFFNGITSTNYYIYSCCLLWSRLQYKQALMFIYVFIDSISRKEIYWANTTKQSQKITAVYKGFKVKRSNKVLVFFSPLTFVMAFHLFAKCKLFT